MTANAFLFSWDQLGIESIVPISQYERIDIDNTMLMLADKPTVRNPLDNIVRVILLRARFNPQRHYEVYSVECDTSLDEQFWREQWGKYPQATAELIRERGHKLYCNRAQTGSIKIT